MAVVALLSCLHMQHRQPSVRVQVACMSRAGCEPGYKKTNQDNCFAFEKYITEDQALFGAMDGHGPNGEGLQSLGSGDILWQAVGFLGLQPSTGRDLGAAGVQGWECPGLQDEQTSTGCVLATVS